MIFSKKKLKPHPAEAAAGDRGVWGLEQAGGGEGMGCGLVRPALVLYWTFKGGNTKMRKH